MLIIPFLKCQAYISYLFTFVFWPNVLRGFPGGSVAKNPPGNAEDTGLIPGSGRSPGGGNGNALQYSCLGNPMDRGAWLDTVHRVQRVGHDWATKQPNNNNNVLSHNIWQLSHVLVTYILDHVFILNVFQNFVMKCVYSIYYHWFNLTIVIYN